MIKTPHSKPYADRLNAINDQLCFGAFLADEATAAMVPVIAAAPLTYTSAAFPANAHASRIHRELGDLPDFARQAMSTLCGNALGMGSEHLQTYCAEIRSAGYAWLGGAPINPKDGEDEQLRDQLALWGVTGLDEIFETVIYMRRRRNHLVHARDTIASAMKTFLAARAAPLDAFWAVRPVKLRGFTFTNPDLDTFTIDDGYAVMNLMRICLSEIDAAFAALLPVDPIAVDLANDRVAAAPHLRSNIPVLIRKVCADLDLQYGRKYSPRVIAPALAAAGYQ
jgi:hypothetical protein